MSLLRAIAIVLLILWLISNLFGASIGIVGSLAHLVWLLLVFAIVLFLIDLITGRRAL